MQDWRRRHLLDQQRPGSAIGDLAAGQEKGDRPAESIRQGMDFGGPSASRATDGLILLPPLPPAAQRCALTADGSMRSSAGGPPAMARAWKMALQTPLADQRWKRL
ncbi:hypothetical protein X772_24510 [Mesorhizobium sp. LSJC280B00]|nr:hypothetical protein X772_24510 [Mesorhizobium sp. LSJC280B00]